MKQTTIAAAMLLPAMYCSTPIFAQKSLHRDLAQTLKTFTGQPEARFALLEKAYELANTSVGSRSTAKVTGTGSRLIASSFRSIVSGVQVLTDSSRYTYSANRGGDLTNHPKYDTLKIYKAPTAGAALKIDNITNASYDANNERTSDTNMRYNSVTGVFDYSNRTLIIRSAGKLSAQQYDYWSGFSWETNALDRYNSDPAGKWSADTMMNSYTPGDYNYAIFSKYNSAGKLQQGITSVYSSGAWNDLFVDDYTYNTAGDLATYISRSNYSGTGLVNEGKSEYGYNTAGRLTQMITYNWDAATSSWLKTTLINYKLDASGNISNVVVSLWKSASGTYDTVAQLVYTYNGYGQTTSATSYSFVSGSWVAREGDSKKLYYYEDFTTAINESALPQAKLSLFPIPASDILQMRIEQPEVKDMDLSITDLQGHVLRKWHYTAVKNIDESLSVSELPSGNYLLRLSDGSARKFVVVH